MAEGEALTIVHGPQGGQHVYVEVLTFATKKETWIYRFNVTNSIGANISSTDTAVTVCGPGWTRSQAIRVVLDSAQPTAAVLSFSARPSGQAFPDVDGGVPNGPLDQTLNVTLQ